MKKVQDVELQGPVTAGVIEAQEAAIAREKTFKPRLLRKSEEKAIRAMTHMSFDHHQNYRGKAANSDRCNALYVSIPASVAHRTFRRIANDMLARSTIYFDGLTYYIST